MRASSTSSAADVSAPGWQFVRLAAPYWHCERKWRVRLAILLLVLLTVAQVALAVWTSYWNRELFDALEARSLKDLILQAVVFVLIFALTIVVTALHLHVKRWVQLDWRQWLTRRLLDQWLSRNHSYQLQFTRGDHDNPDGRIAEDIRIATESAVALAHSLFYSILILGSFVDILLSVSGSLQIPGTGVEVPAYLVLLAFVYAGVGIALSMLFGRPLISATNRLQTVEANLRFGLGQARENAELIALMHGEGIERHHADRLFADVGRGWNRQTLGFLGVVSFSSGYGTLLPVFPILVAAPQYIAGVMTLGVLMQAAQAFQKLTSALSWPVDNLGELARCRASVDRVVSLHKDMLLLEERAWRPVTHRIGRRPGSARELVLRDLSLANPDGRVLLEHLDLTIHRGERVLISGDPMVAASLFKAVAGLWPWGDGQILLPVDQSIVFLPQSPYLPDGSLRDALSYPRPAEDFSTAELRRALECAGVAWLTPRLEETDSWDRVLPLRARQRLGFARLLLHRPAWVFLEEATSAFDPEKEGCMTDLLYRELPGTTIITISFHEGLEHRFTRKLVLARLAEEKFLACDEALPCALRET